MQQCDRQSRTVAGWVRHCEKAMKAAGLHFGHGTDNALDESAWLVLHVLGERLDGGFEGWDHPVDAPEARRLLALLGERIRGREPLAYLLGEAWFAGLAFEITRDVLVPRSPLAELLQQGYAPWAAQRTPLRLLDLCTGSGCIAVASAVHLTGAQVVATDISAPALEVARRNAARHGVQERVEVVASDLFAGLRGRRFDLVVTNPPYVPAVELAGLPPEYRAEPELGLVSGEDGLDFPLRILQEAANYLEADGVLICEVGESAPALERLLDPVPFCWLEFEQGGEGVFVLDRSALLESRAHIDRTILARRGASEDERHVV